MIEELAQHLDDRYRSLIARGSSEEAARAAVRQELNDDGLERDLRRIVPAPQTHELVVGGGPRGRWFGGLWQDARYARASAAADTRLYGRSRVHARARRRRHHRDL